MKADVEFLATTDCRGAKIARRTDDEFGQLFVSRLVLFQIEMDHLFTPRDPDLGRRADQFDRYGGRDAVFAGVDLLDNFKTVLVDEVERTAARQAIVTVIVPVNFGGHF